MARERVGPATAALKTRQELLRALGLDETPSAENKPPETPLVTTDFFIARPK